MTYDHAPIAAEELLEHSGFLRRLARELTRDAESAADLVQETYRVALERPPSARGPLRGWLATVAANLARNRRRSERRRDVREAAVARDERVEPDALVLERLEVQRALVELVMSLPPEQRTVLHLRYFEDLAPRAIAERLGASVKTVKARQARALAALRARLDARSHGDRTRWLAALAPFAGHTGIGTGVGGALAGGLVMKKTILVAGAALVALTAWTAWRQGGLGERLAASRSPRTEVAEGPLVTPPPPLAAALPPGLEPVREELGGNAALVAGGALEITLRRHDGTLAADVPLAVTCDEDPAPRARVRRTRTALDGRALVEGLLPGTARLWLDRDRFEAEVAAGETRAIAFTLTEQFTVEGVVVDAAGAPVEGAEVWAGSSSRWWPGGFRLGTSASDGSFRLRDVDAFTAVGARKRGYVASQCEAPMDVAGTADGARSMTLVLATRGGAVRGRVLDPDGHAIEGAEILAGPDGGTTSSAYHGHTPYPAYALTDAAGRFELENDLPPGTHPIHVAADGFPVWRGEIVVVEGSAAELEVRLERPARIVGRVLGVDGAPVSGAKVLASEEDRGGWYHDRFAPPEGVTDAEGRFTLEWVASGTRELNAHDYDRPEIGRARASVVCAAGETATCELRLELGHTITGRVVDGAGLPLAGWSVNSKSPFSSWWYPRRALTGADGRFTLANLGDGAHDLDVRDAAGSHPLAQVAGVPVGTTDLEIVVADAGSAKGLLQARVVSPGENPANLTAILWKEGANEGHFLEVDPSGALEAEVFPGSYRVVVKRGSEEVLSSPAFDVEPGSVADLGDLLLEGPGRVEVELVPPTGIQLRALAGLGLSLEREGSSSVELEWEDELLVASEVVAGTWTVTMREDELFLRIPGVEVAAGATTRVQGTIEFPVRVALTFENPARDDVTITARDASGRTLSERRWTSYGDPPRLSVGLPPGRATIAVRTHAGLRGEVTLDVAHGRDPEPLVIRLE